MKTFVVLFVAIALFSGCAPRGQLVTATIRPSIHSVPASGSAKTFVSQSPSRFGTFEIKSGASITWTSDGRAVFSCSVRGYEQDEAALRIVARRANGTVVLQYPPHEHVYLPVKPGCVATPYDIVFGFDRWLFPEIAKVEWQLTTYGDSKRN